MAINILKLLIVLFSIIYIDTTASLASLIAPKSIVTDNNGYIYVITRGTKQYHQRNKIYKYSPDGRCPTELNKMNEEISSWISSINELDNANIVEIKINGRKIEKNDIYEYAKYLKVSPTKEEILKKIFTPDYITMGLNGEIFATGSTFNSNSNGQIGIIDNNDGHTILAFGEFTREDTPHGLWNPWGIAADSKGNMYIANQGPYCVKKYDKNGKFVAKWGKRGSGDGEFANAVSIAVDKRNDDVYVVDSYAAWDRISQERIQKFTKDGKFIRKWGEHFGLLWVPMGWVPISYPVMTNISDLDTPAGIAVDNKGFVYVVERGKNRIHKYDENGNLILSFAGERGTGPGQFNLSGTINMPVGISVDKDNNVYVCDEENNRVQKFDENGRYLMEIK